MPLSEDILNVTSHLGVRPSQDPDSHAPAFVGADLSIGAYNDMVGGVSIPASGLTGLDVGVYDQTQNKSLLAMPGLEDPCHWRRNDQRPPMEDLMGHDSKKPSATPQSLAYDLYWPQGHPKLI